MTFAHVAIRLSYTQRVVDYLVALKHFDYSRSLGYKQPITSTTIMTSPIDEMVFTRGLKLYDLILSFLVLSRTNIGSKTFLRSLWKVLILCDFLKFGMSQNNHDVTATKSHGVSIFLWNVS